MTSMRESVRVQGPDASAYLQGQISQDVTSLADGEVAWSLILQPTGKVAAWFRIMRESADSYLLDIDEGYRNSLIARLERFKLRTNATIAAVSDAISEPLMWPGLVDAADNRQRILAGLPRMGAELTEQTIPGEGGQHFIDSSVSFTKGCYTGQELVARIDSRGGNVPRPVRVLRAVGPLKVGDEVSANGKVVGVITSAAGDVALAPLKRLVEIGDVVLVGGVEATISEPAGS